MKIPCLRCFRCSLWPLALLCFVLILGAHSTARAQASGKLTTIRSLGPDDAAFPTSLILGRDGNFYGTSPQGGVNGAGTISRVTPAGVLTVLHRFDGSASSVPSELTQASDGNFYGTTSGRSTDDLGTVFQITPAGEFKTLYTFQGSYSDGPDGAFPAGGLAEGSDGTLYGTTYGGGVGYGTFYSITQAGVLTIILRLPSSLDSGNPNSSLVAGNDGNFYGSVRGYGYSAAQGGPFRITPAGVMTFVGSFDRPGGGWFIKDRDGNVYVYGNDYTTTFNKVTPGSSGPAHFTLPNYTRALVAGNDGNFYGTTSSQGDASGNSSETVFQLTPESAVATLHNFSVSDGSYPGTPFVQGSDGCFYGTTTAGGDNGLGTFYKLKASPQPAFFAGESLLTNEVYYLTLPNGNLFGYYSFLDDPHYFYHIDLGYEYVFDAADGNGGVYLYDFASNGFFYTSPSFPFPYLYDFSLNSVLYYYPDTSHPGRYSFAPRYFYNFSTGEILTK